MRNKKGFTLVELVIVIAVIAILAGVMIGTFASVVKKAEKSREQQELKQQEIAQKADDVLAKIENADWFGWEDFETSLATKISEQTKENNDANNAAYIAALKQALDEYAKKAAESNTALTEAQVKYIIENAISKQGTGATEAQVKAIINAAVSGMATPLTKSQVQALIESAKGYTIDQVQKIVDAAVRTISVPTKDDIASIVKDNTLTEDQIKAILEASLPVTKTVKTADELAAAAKNLNSGSTLNVKGVAEATITLDENKTLYIRGDKMDKLTINAPAATIGVYNEVTTLDVVEAAPNSVHVYGKVGTVNVNAGRVVIEAASNVTNVNVVPSANKSVKLVVAPTVKVSEVKVDNQNGASVEVTNEGKVDKIEVTPETKAPVSIDTSKGEANVDNKAEDVVTVNGKGTAFNGGTISVSGTYYLEKDTTTAIIVNEGVTAVLDLNGHNISVTGAHAITNNSTLTVKGEGTVDALSHGKAAFYNNAGATAVLDGGTYTRSKEAGMSKSNSGGNSWYVVYNDGTLTFNKNVVVKVIDGACFSSMIINGKEHASSLVFNGGSYTGGLNTLKNDEFGVATINDGIFTATTQGAILNWNELVINGGTFKSGTEKMVFFSGVYEDSKGATIINSGVFSGGFGTLQTYDGWKVTVNAGTFTYDFSKDSHFTVPSTSVYDPTTGVVTIK